MKAQNWPGEKTIPIRLRGYSELVMGSIDPKLRKKIAASLKRGYRLDDKDDHSTLLNMICKHNPFKSIRIGYVGKARFLVYVPTYEDAEDLRQELDAQTVMTEAFKGKDIHTHEDTKGYSQVYFRAQEEAGGKGSKNQPQLKARFTQLRYAIDEWMEKDAAIREQIARWCADDDSCIRIPFDSHRKRK
jgi:hypothetical protein